MSSSSQGFAPGVAQERQQEGGTSLDRRRFTAVFDGDIRSFGGNPFLTDTPFGRPRTVGVGDAFDQLDAAQEGGQILLDALNEIAGGTTPGSWPERVSLKAIEAYEAARNASLQGASEAQPREEPNPNTGADHG